MDGALQTVMGFLQNADPSSPFLPFALGEVEIIQPLLETCYAYATLSQAGTVNTFTIQLLDSSGQVLVRMRDFSMRAITHTATSSKAVGESAASDLWYFKPVWENESTPTPSQQGEKTSTPVLIFDTDETLFQRYKEQLNREDVMLVKPGAKYGNTGHHVYTVNPQNQEDYRVLIQALHDNEMIPGKIIYLWSKVDGSGQQGGSIDAQLAYGVYALLYLTQALLAHTLKERVRVLYLYEHLRSDSNTEALHAAMSGFARTIRLENPKCVYQILNVEKISETEVVLDNLFREFQAEDSAVDIRYDQGQRQVMRFREYDSETESVNAIPLKEKGVYLITGGLGGLGRIFAEYLARQWKATLVLAGRSELSSEKKATIKKIEELGAEVTYITADVSKLEDVRTLITETKSRFKAIDGILHAAGVLRDAFIANKTKSDLDAVLAPKIQSTLYLDETTHNEQLDFFVLFSSIAAVMGNVGQCDYAYANSFMDHFAQIREDLRKDGKRVGRTLSINWPLWQEGGMAPDEQSIRWLEKHTGMVPLQTDKGIEAFLTALPCQTNQFIVAQGDRAKLRGWLGIESELTPRPPLLEIEGEDKLPSISKRGAGGEVLPPAALQQKVEEDLIQVCCDLLKVTAEDLDKDVEFIEYGVDSIMMMSVLNRIEDLYGETVEPNAMSEYPTITRFAEYLIKEQIVKPSELTPQPPLLQMRGPFWKKR